LFIRRKRKRKHFKINFVPHRIQKINELVKQQISEILTRELDLKPGIFVTVSGVDTSRDLRYTRIFLSVFPEKESHYVFNALKNELYEIQGILNKKLSMHPLPRIEFVNDLTESKADEVEKILKKIK
jgi:ribosome-binding factor A